MEGAVFCKEKRLGRINRLSLRYYWWQKRGLKLRALGYDPDKQYIENSEFSALSYSLARKRQ
tara:strand:+ start:2221 stop:2406 length:186 start_codon:yes stop_codon:yes gene_type:complete